MPTLYHPTLPEVTQQVGDDAKTLKAWTDQGWLKEEPAEFVKARKAADKAAAGAE